MPVPRGRAFIALLAAAALLTAVSGAFAARSADPVTINVTARDYALKLSAKTAPAGKVTFVVKNTGKADHSFQIAGKKTPAIKPGKSATLVVTFTKTGQVAYTSTVAGDASKGMTGTLTVKAAAPAPSPALTAGRDVFVSTGCGACHTIKAAGSTGATGPNLDRSIVPLTTVLARITSGKGVMQAYADTLTSQQIQDVAQFVFQSRAG